MSEAVAWACAVLGVVLGGIAAFVPGFPGAAVALLGAVAFAAITDFRVVPPPALAFATAIAVVATGVQLLAPVSASRAAGGTAGAATGAALGAIVGAFVPLPAASAALAIAGAVVLGAFGARRQTLAWIRGVGGAASGCMVGIAADLVAVVAIAAILALADFAAAVR